MKNAMSERVQLSLPDTCLKDFLNVRRLTFNTENGTKVMRVGDVSIDQVKSPLSKNNLKTALAFVLGLFASMA